MGYHDEGSYDWGDGPGEGMQEDRSWETGYANADRVRESLEDYNWPEPGRVPELLYLVDPDDPKGKWFPVHERASTMYPSIGRHVHIPNGTFVLERAQDHLRRWMGGHHGSPWGIMAWARNKTQIRDELVGRGYKVMFNSKIQEVDPMTRLGDNAESSYDSLLASAQESLERAQLNAQRLIEAAASIAAAQVDAAQRRLDRLARMPREPQIGDDGRQPVIRFQRVFVPGGRSYDYAAARTSEGRWNTTGPKAPKDYSWAELINWIMEGSDVVDVEVATSFGDL